jgi:hypothetical protein
MAARCWNGASAELNRRFQADAPVPPRPCVIPEPALLPALALSDYGYLH